VLGGLSENLLGNSKSSLAVFYVEQVALNRHVAATAAVFFMLENEGEVKKERAAGEFGRRETADSR
jgi:hypothetical protein